jgi:xylan 1,4-beta-xylosidase
MKLRVFFCRCLPLALTGLATAAASTSVAFHEFEYTGRDTIFEQPLPQGHFRNPILAGFYPDPSICRVGDDYYLINSTFSYFPGIPIFHSRDLVNWKQLGHVVDRPTQLNFDGLGITRGLFAPTISHHNGTFYVVCTLVDGGGNFLMTATNPAGPWSDPIWLKFDGIDPSLYFDDDGRAWMVNNGGPPHNRPLYQGHRAIWLQEFDIATRTLIGPRSIIVNGGADISTQPVWIEGPHLYKREGWYYLCCAEGGTSTAHSQVILRSKSVTGPFIPWSKNPILTQRDLDGTVAHAVTCTGHADLVDGPDGKWWSVFLACRPFAGRFWTTGRETFLLPVTWTDDGWPLILPPGERVPYTLPSPLGSEVHSATSVDQPPLTGNFTWRDEFDDQKVDPLWIMLRQPHETWWQQANGELRLTPQREHLSGRKNPSFLGRRLQHAKFDTRTTLTPPKDRGVSAGLVVLQSETHHFYLGVRRDAKGLTVFLEKWDGPVAVIVREVTLVETDRVALQLKGDDLVLSFSYATSANNWQAVSDKEDSTPITVQAAGGGLHFTGAVVGMHARLE